MKAGIIVMLILILVTNAYVVWRMWQILPTLWLKIAVPVLYVLAFIAFFGGFAGILNNAAWAAKLNTASSSILVVYIFSLIAFLIVDLGRLCKFIPKDFAVNSVTGSAAVFGAIALILIIGAVNYRVKRRETLEITTSKHLEKPLKIVLASDLHIGYNNDRRTLAKWIDRINSEQPDLVIFGGDIIDNSVRPLFEHKFAEEFHRLAAPAYAVFGNHEFISGADQSMKFYREAGINLLRDSVARVRGLALIGRDDRSRSGHPAPAPADTSARPARQSSARARQPLTELTRSISPDEFTILIDHQPYNLEEAEQAGIDFQFSGHTHRGQIWPLTWAINFMYEKAWGHYQRGSTRYYISSGLGIWGPKFRLGSRSEYLVLTLRPLVETQSE